MKKSFLGTAALVVRKHLFTYELELMKTILVAAARQIMALLFDLCKLFFDY